MQTTASTINEKSLFIYFIHINNWHNNNNSLNNKIINEIEDIYENTKTWFDFLFII